MATRSTKSNKPRPAQEGRRNGREEENREKRFAEVQPRWFLYLSSLILLLAALLRVYALSVKPMHHDEGVNGFFLTNLVRMGTYAYDPSNYHGPTLYYLTVPLVILFGLQTFTVRLVIAAFGVATVYFVLRLRQYIGSVGALAAALLLAVSPAAVFYSRYFIHETLFVFFTLGIVIGVIRFQEAGRVVAFLCAAASAAFLFATKETAFIAVGTLALAWIVASLWSKQRILPEVSSPRRAAALGAAALGVFVVINVIFYSSFFTNWAGLKAAVQSLAIWTSTGTSEFHEKPFLTYMRILVQEEAPILFLAAAGSLVALFKRPSNRFAIFAGAWAFGTLLAYSLIPYKTPWLALNFVAPMAIVGGYAVQALGGRLALPVVVVAASVSAYQSVIVNFWEYDNDRYPYVYSQTHRELHTLVAQVDRLAERVGAKEIGITIASPENWPLPWYFRDNPKAGYPGTLYESYDPNTTHVLIARESADPQLDQTARLRPLISANYSEVGIYTLRPGVRLAVFARRDLF